MLSFLKLRAVVNDRDIYPLSNLKPVVIPVFENQPRLVITDGYHISRPVKLVFSDFPVCCLNVQCVINDSQLVLGFVILAISYITGLYTGMLVFKVVSFLPIIYLLLFYYLNRKDFFRLVQVSA